VIANTEYFSRGAWRHSGAQYGTYNGMSYSLEAEYRSDPGELVNQDYVVRQLEGKFKYDLSPSDSVFIRIGDYDSSGGDLRNVSSEADVAQQFRFHVERRPFILTGYHHEWSPSSHTLIMAGYLDATLTGDIPSSGVFALNRLLMRPPSLDGVFQVNVHHTNENRFKSYTIEAQQLVQNGRNSLIAGVGGTWNQENIFDSVSLSDFSQLYWFYLGPGNPVTQQRTSLSYAAASTYAYDYFRLTDSLELAGGLNFTHQESPSNPNTAPVSISRDTKDHVGPKAALIWSPTEAQSFRVAYTQSLSPVTGAGDIVRLEPSHVAGLVQSFREVAPFSIVGPLDAAEIETAEALWEGRFGNTFIAVGGQHLSSRLDRHAGLFLSGQNLGDPPSFGLIEEDIRFREEAAQLSVHQLLSREWSFGAQYRGSYAKLERTYPEYKGRMIGVVDDQSEWRGWLHTLKLTWLYRNRSGVFARSDATFFLQEHERDAASLPEQRFWQVNAFGGYRFARQRAEVTVGVLNLMDKDNHLDPVNYFNDLPRARTFYARLLLDF
jgi:outer membrane receptor protein involved in Fe transport